MSTQSKLFATAFALIVTGGVIIAVMRGNPAASAAKKPDASAVPVTAAAVVTKTSPLRIRVIGNVEPYASVAVKARIDGQIVAVHFREGDEIRQGADLFQIDPRPFEAALHQVEANLQRDRAMLTSAQAQERRSAELLSQHFITQQIYDQARTNAETAAATVHADEAAVENARLQLDYCRIRSPINGYAGRIMLQLGNMVKANDANPLVVINQVVPVYASFAVPEQHLGEIRRLQQRAPLRVQVATDNEPPLDGEVSFIDNSTDLTTGTIKLKARFANADRRLWPGQFVNLSLTLRQQDHAIVVPSLAIQNGPNGQYVFVIKSDSTAELRTVKVDRAEGDDTIVADGLAAGEQVVTTGQLRLTPGAMVSLPEAATPP